MASLLVSFRIDGAIASTVVATNSKYSWKLNPKENITIRIPRKKLDSGRTAKGVREKSPARRRDPSPRAREESEFSEDGLSSGASSEISDGDLEDQLQHSSKKRKKSAIVMTARQRSMVDGGESGNTGLLSIQDRKKAEKVLTQEQLTKKKAQAKKRKLQQEQAAEKTKQETIDKILNAKGDKYRREVKQRTNQEAQRRTKDLEVPHVRWHSSRSDQAEFSTLSFSKNATHVPPLFRSLFVGGS